MFSISRFKLEFSTVKNTVGIKTMSKTMMPPKMMEDFFHFLEEEVDPFWMDASSSAMIGSWEVSIVVLVRRMC